MQKKIPQRRCTGCNQTLPKNQLIRVVKDPDGTISVDLTGKKAGRGAYLCNSKTCLAKAQKSKRLQSSLKCQIEQEIFSGLEREIIGE